MEASVAVSRLKLECPPWTHVFESLDTAAGAVLGGHGKLEAEPAWRKWAL